MHELYDNKTAFINTKPKTFRILHILFATSLFFIVILLVFVKISEHFDTKGIILCDNECILKTSLPSNIDYNVIKTNNQVLKTSLIDKSLEVNEEELISYYMLSLKVVGDYTDKEIINLSFYYNEERLITKIAKKFFN